MLTRELAAFAARLAWQQLVRRARRSLGAWLGVVGALVLVLTQLGFEGGLQDSAVRVHARMTGELVVVHERFRAFRYLEWLERDAAAAALAHPEVLRVSPLALSQFELRNPATQELTGVLGIGIDLDNPALAIPVGGTQAALLRLPGRVSYDLEGQPVFGDILPVLARDGAAEVQTGAPSATLQETLTIVGTHRLGTSVAFDSTLLMSEATLAAVTGRSRERITLAVLALRPGASPEQVAAELRARLPPGLRVVTRAALVAEEQRFWSETTPIGFVFFFGVIVGYAICALSVWQALGQVLDENLPEYAVLRTMGYPDGFFLLLVVLTALLLTAGAVPVASTLALGLYAVMSGATGLSMELAPGRVLWVGALATLTGLLTALLARNRFQRADPAALMG